MRFYLARSPLGSIILRKRVAVMKKQGVFNIIFVMKLLRNYSIIYVSK